VCLGNICRSPLARAVFADAAARRGVGHRFEVDSCGTGGWHAGESADPRAIAVARRNGLVLAHTARQLSPADDFVRFDLLVAMDRSNRDELIRLGARPPQVRLLRSFDPAARGHDADIPDPYYGSESGFDLVYRLLVAASEGLLDTLEAGRWM
jgi:protein-tyrosine phosphatase